MIKALISGYGKMGHCVEQCLNRAGIEIVAKTDSLIDIPAEICRQCACIDFSTPEAFRRQYEYMAQNCAAAVIGTTGWQDIRTQVINAFEQAGTPMIWASNFSLGVNVLTAAVDRISQILGQTRGYQAYVVEKHHIHKLDAPSGTAITLAQHIEDGLGEAPSVASVRVGEVAGIHTIGFEGADDRITIEHEAFSRMGFASGAVLAAQMTESLEGVAEFSTLILTKQ